jgi:phospholipase/carboxylesterase
MLEALVRRPSTPSANPPLLILLHGLGADEHDLMGLSRELDPRLLIVSLRAPLEYDFGGYAWFDVRWDADGVHADAQQALNSREILLEEIEGLSHELGIEPSKLFLGGFSQGAMMSLGASIARPELFSGVILLSGRLLPEFVAGERNEGFSRLPFLVQHGIQDQVLPIEGARDIRSFLQSQGCPLTYHEYPMAHEINYESLVELRDWLGRQIG